MQEMNMVQTAAIWALPVILAITLHEAAHGYVAAKRGDKTALMLGRVTLNPIKHIDPIGTIVVPLVLLLTGGFLFGWAKPVPVNTQNLHKPERDMALVAAAGPISNLLMGIGWALLARLAVSLHAGGSELAEPLYLMGMAGISINVILFVLNLLPMPPLDGSRIVRPALKGGARRAFDSLERYGIIIIMLLFFTGVLSPLLRPLLGAVQQFIGRIAGL